MLILVTGGSGSGKSQFAEGLVMQLHTEPYLYVATMYPFDEECHQRIRRHRNMRAEKHFETLECYTGLARADIKPYGTVLLECMSNLTANEMYQEGGAGEQTVEAIVDGIDHLLTRCEHLVIVSNEIFSDGIDYDPETVRYQKYLGAINREIAKKADLVVEVVYSIPVIHKGNLDEVLPK
jgi:adenosylcobinamide kinase/adenosylcobinamide-phosphate guanylyltransferase